MTYRALVVNKVDDAFQAAVQRLDESALPAGEVTIRMTRNEAVYRLSVQDNGVGLPPGFDLGNSTSLGLQLVSTLTDQINGVLEIQGTGGTEFSIVFPAQ